MKQLLNERLTRKIRGSLSRCLFVLRATKNTKNNFWLQMGVGFFIYGERKQNIQVSEQLTI